MKAGRPSYGPAIKALLALKASGVFSSPAHRETIDEIAHRVRRLESGVGQLMNLNDRLIERRVPQPAFDPETDIVTYRLGETEHKIRLKRADPNVPITMRGLTVGGAYKAGTNTAEGHPSDPDEADLEALLESYYNNAHKVLDLVQSLPGLEIFKCREITIVRNKLLEHTRPGEVYSFGFGSTGPVMRPIHGPDREWHDKGLVPNTESFARRLADAFAGRATTSP